MTNMSLGLLAPVFWLLAATAHAQAQEQAQEPTSGTVALTFEMGSPVVTLTLRTADGTVRPTRLLVDTGGGALMLAEPVATELGLSFDRAQAMAEEGMTYAPMATPRLEIDGLRRSFCDPTRRKPAPSGPTPSGFQHLTESQERCGSHSAPIPAYTASRSNTSVAPHAPFRGHPCSLEIPPSSSSPA